MRPARRVFDGVAVLGEEEAILLSAERSQVEERRVGTAVGGRRRGEHVGCADQGVGGRRRRGMRDAVRRRPAKRTVAGRRGAIMKLRREGYARRSKSDGEKARRTEDVERVAVSVANRIHGPNSVAGLRSNARGAASVRLLLRLHRRRRAKPNFAVVGGVLQI